MLRRLRERLGIPVQSGPSHRAEIQNGLSPVELVVLDEPGFTAPLQEKRKVTYALLQPEASGP